MTLLFQEFPELESLSRQDLEELLQSPSYLDAVYSTLPRTEALKKREELLMLSNEDLAKRNMELGETLMALRRDTQHSYDEATAAYTRWNEIEKQLKDIDHKTSTAFLTMRLKQAVSQQDDLSETIASDFISSANMDEYSDPKEQQQHIDTFVKEFKQMRKLYHKRNIWADKASHGDVIWQ
ncbi:hypothetical protein E3P92_02072 [Wallemia ichthyophaga]|uniref:VPS37 C-terminal domain-containing protein n=2 Tax=Wallemia ichthyophaga TaxID=245174 RepID=A0A4T0HH15_WALIC|nr:Vacuolar protein sorting-associated protein 37A [Wallemia ichthyophaga EXF-994]TIA72134.1 hypothetical protein E3P91_02169 [Wallemia ichthyophaga]EOQ99887.1 Vacuolar protein sorting-associated protein 37A [Wallemia ichthyophaga EXF-994]TIB04350.1 hypothetical protein E3P95_00258 [Wallemia ichthyophaga]TIB05453.1 hypothetical protein E3P94_00258 [Wallemia ichthyophaga]TIB12768.1 hypothetical protein E3P90_01866 [Wallemia ichthyophaga]